MALLLCYNKQTRTDSHLHAHASVNARAHAGVNARKHRDLRTLRHTHSCSLVWTPSNIEHAPTAQGAADEV